MTDVVRDVLRYTDFAIFAYFIALNSGYLALIVLAGLEFREHLRRMPFAGADDMFRSPLTLPVSVIVPAHNEGAGIVAAVQAMTALRYPRYEVVVVDDGSSDDTFERLRAQFDLVAVPRVVPSEIPYRSQVLSVHVARANPETLTVVRKTNGGKADALNVGINLARHPLVCMVDADSVLDPDALLSVAKPFGDDPLRVAACGGVVRIANGCKVVGGRVVDVRMPKPWLLRVQVVEYLRAFLMGRTGWSRLGGLVVISGAFGIFRRDLVVEVGGMDPDTIGEDAELVVRLHHHLRRRHADYRVIFVAEPVSWSEAPSRLRVLGRQRRRWHRGIAEILSKHRGMILNPRYGRIGLLALPYYVLFELLAPFVELAAVVLLPLGLWAGAVDVGFAWRFVLVAYGYGLLVSLVSLFIEEVSFHRYPRWSDIARGVAAALVENFGYRQVLAVWQAWGALGAWRGRKAVWGVMHREGFGGDLDSPEMVGVGRG
ncbi:glycosyl transferase family 2 [Actinoplanes sp. NBRC 14428]|uniref:Cellulose synthase/poly-beta-1,6-N-acetylglucosamine synthase-like glycosyltransferase n=1 Tax=Pseudosporangium ferrugineum TaxID=439699 RepID=A0A2T0RLA4_9ACTN|nr:glycosyltransferase [Pseudosporangium ferrugineum]PRY21975.1 cellulose synthase/poly-beta-1,6-N-acetylglucosamine synthase-like glycosyltransferase [Pseudosporangium ferrugineum]BCJ50755.1 glycosyl transferase family 2 [Actinoplanes sp. NBRC 14428]